MFPAKTMNQTAANPAQTRRLGQMTSCHHSRKAIAGVSRRTASVLLVA